MYLLDSQAFLLVYVTYVVEFQWSIDNPNCRIWQSALVVHLPHSRTNACLNTENY